MFVHQQAHFKHKAFFLDNDDMLSTANIVDRYRHMYIFIDKNEYDQFKNVQSGKMLLLNCSLSKESSSQYVKYGNLLRFCINLYTFNVEFITSFKDYRNAICMLETAYSSDSYNDLDSRRYVPENQLIFENKSSLNSSFLKEILIDNEIQSNTIIPEPKYYTPKHQFLDIGEIPDALNMTQTTITYRLEELKDNKTSIRILPFNQWETFKQRKLNELKHLDFTNSEEFYKHQEQIDSVGLLEDLFSYTAETMLEGLIFSYDSTTKEAYVNKSDVVKPTMSFYKHRFQEQVINSILQTKDMIKRHMEYIENQYGSILFFYSPFTHGDQFRIKFRDYNPDNQPVLTKSENVDKIYSLDTTFNSFAGDIMSMNDEI